MTGKDRVEKLCPKCKEIKLFYNNKGKNSWCIDCFLKNKRESYQRHKDTYRKQVKEYRKTHPIVSNYRKKYPLKYKAHMAISEGLRYGRIEKPNTCQACGEVSEKIEGHHWKGYEKPYWLDVQWLCVPCHVVADGRRN